LPTDGFDDLSDVPAGFSLPTTDPIQIPLPELVNKARAALTFFVRLDQICLWFSLCDLHGVRKICQLGKGGY
jgi:hypothetical protein